MNLKNGKVFTSKFIGTGPSSYKKRIYRDTVSQRLRDTGLCQPGLITAGQEPPVPAELGTEWAQDAVWTFWRRGKTFCPYRDSKAGLCT